MTPKRKTKPGGGSLSAWRSKETRAHDGDYYKRERIMAGGVGQEGGKTTLTPKKKRNLHRAKPIEGIFEQSVSGWEGMGIALTVQRKTQSSYPLVS